MNDPQARPTNHQRLVEKALAQSTHGTGASALPATPGLAELAKDFPDYEFIELIGRGGMGAVYQAVQRNLQRTVAIKVLPKDLASNPEFGERFLREAQTLATLNHPSILTVYDYGERNGVFFLVTEFVDGVNLRQLMELGELSPAEALRIAPQLCTALQFAHERGVVHRDIKPENILIDTNGQVLLADFGLAKVARPGDAVELTRNTAVLGTPHYMAPEQWNGARQVDHRADIYSLGVVLYEMLTGNLPLGNFDMPSERSGVPQGLDAVVRRALAQQPKNRYQHARDVQSDVEQQAQQLGGQQPDDQQHAGPSTEPATQPQSDAKLIKIRSEAFMVVVLSVCTLGLIIFALALGWRQLTKNSQRSPIDLESYGIAGEWASVAAPNGQEINGIIPMPITPPNPLVSMVAVKVESKDLLGKTRVEVLEQMGPPVGIGHSASSEAWCYLNEQEQRVEQAIVFAGDHVASTDSEQLTLLSNPADMSLPQLSQSMNEFVKLYRVPASRPAGQLASTFTFDNGAVVTVRDGVVVGVDGK